MQAPAQQNQIAVDYQDNPTLAEAFATKNQGDKVRVEVEFTITEKDDKGLKGKISKIAPEGYEPASPNEPDEIEPDAQDEPVMMVINARKATR